MEDRIAVWAEVEPGSTVASALEMLAETVRKYALSIVSHVESAQLMTSVWP
ncbi:hypothetical protein [Kineosporia babensis]|uniref:Uncharacterized protein n=1 Tax=Kineosporia babensis TaxID=499548 RepID=A0A9X1N9Q2_9ACTN|nr:hypothetical protein [Kineosporia babensis]MCD5309869.1 hypothetical protein [Kineosporia babensis]